ncbi:MAG TPA: ABC transporter ATP-binding protein [Caproicibacter sp.]|nr:ABC transporter ATP-binding protein [Caproicibacter sp.]
MIHVENLSVRYGANLALSDVSLDIAQGEYLGIIGPNGGGKTTLLKAILGLVPISAGSVSVCGKPAGKVGTLAGYVPQFSAMEKDFPVLVREVVLTGRLTRKNPLFHRYDASDRAAATSALKEVGIADLAGRRINALSGGEFQKMLIARALAVGPKILMLDEPTASVDAKSRAQIFELLERLNRKGMTILLVTHDTLAISSQVHRLACLNRTLVYHGEPELDEKTVDALYGCPVDLIAHGVPHRVLKTHTEGK